MSYDCNVTSPYTTYGNKTFSTREEADAEIQAIYARTPAGDELFEIHDDPLRATFNRAKQAWEIFYRPYGA